MKKIKLFLLAAIAFTSFNTNAQTVDEIVNMNTEAMGGKDKLASLKTIKMSATISAQGVDIPVVITKSHMIGMRTDFEYNGTAYYQVANNKKGQIFSPGMSDPIEMDEDTYKSYVNQMDVQGALFNYKDKGTSIELAGTEKVDGAEAYNLKVTYKNGKISNYYVDKKSNRLVKTKAKQNMMGQEMEVETTFSDYKQNADGYWFPYTATNSVRGPINFEKIETNVAVDEKTFSN